MGKKKKTIVCYECRGRGKYLEVYTDMIGQRDCDIVHCNSCSGTGKALKKN